MPKRNVRVYIRVEAGATVGMGHLARQAILAQAFVAAGCAVTMVTQGPEVAQWRPSGLGWDIVRPGHPETYLRVVAQEPGSLIILDVPQANQDSARELQAYGPVVQFDTLDPDAAADLVVIPGLHITEDLLQAMPMPVLTGPASLLIPPGWASRRRAHAPDREPYLVITAGGGQPRATLERAADEARRWPWGRHAYLMAAPWQIAQGQPLATNSPVQWRPWEPSWLFHARLAVIPLGQTVWETLYAWTPLCTWARTEADQARLPALQTYEVRGAPALNPWETIPEAWGAQIQAAWEDTAWHARATACLQALPCDTDGHTRIARACLQLLTKRDANYAKSHF